MELHKCGPDELDELISIGRETYFDTFHSMNSDETMAQYLNEAFSHEKIGTELRNPNSSFYLIYDNASPAAYMKLNLPPAQSDLNDTESLELERIYVKAAYKGSGFGRFLIERAISFGREYGCTYVWLGVWEKNDKAIGFYKRMGFEISGTHTFRMGDELQNDFIMKLKI